MEMHQVRYFLAVARVLNFTRAAEECHVSQPSLTRAVKLLEDELGGELFRRERNLTHLTDLGHRMRPLIQQCYDSAVSAKALATSIKKGAVAPLALAVSGSVNVTLLVPHLAELTRAFSGLELQFMRGAGDEVSEFLKRGDAELLVAGSLAERWDRLDCWPLLTESFELVVSKEHRLAARDSIEMEELAEERMLVRAYCETTAALDSVLRSRNVAMLSGRHKMVSDHDLVEMINANLGVGVLPRSAPTKDGLRHIPIKDLDLSRTIHVYAVAGRQRSPAAAAFVKLIRAADWSEVAIKERLRATLQ